MRAVRMVVIACSAVAVLAAEGRPVTDDPAIAHLLNRIAFGPRAGDIEQVRALGIDRYIDRQLRPDRISDDAVAARLAGFETLGLSAAAIVDQFERPVIEARRERRAAADGATPSPAQRRANTLVHELSAQKVLRAVYSERQLQEVLTDFWFNHFNVDARKGRTRFFVTAYERDVIRPHVLGRFRDLLGATAKSPAMLFYLDNWMSTDPGGPHPIAPPPRAARGRFGARREPARTGMAVRPQNRPRGLNENYGRELLELHTLGVEGGYTQQDVIEVARAFTGWTIEPPQRGGGFVFRPQLHDFGRKFVLGHVIKAGGGESDGEEVLDILARHPATARFIATKLARRFVSDDPPPALIDRAAERFRQTDGDIREVVRTILRSSEFQAADARAAKAKTPFEFVVSALRAVGVEVDDARPFVRMIEEMGMPLYQCQPPTGYKDTAAAWIDSGALVARINAAVRIAAGNEELALRLGSPEFQRR